MFKIVVDTLGADHDPSVIAVGAAHAIAATPDLFVVLVGPAAQLQQVLNSEGADPARYEIIDTCSYIRNSDPPTCIFGGCDDSSMAMAYGRLKQDASSSAMLSAGNTGALLVGSICRLGLLPGLKFPALASALPCSGEKLLCLVDCGSNVECTPDDLALFAKMGHVFSKSYCGIDSPRVALMSVGREAQKGTQLTRQAFEKISALGLNFVGNAEGSDLVSGYADVIVTDGFSGNLLLKCAEAVGKAAAKIAESYGAELPVVNQIRQALLDTFDFNSQGAATFLGPRKTVVKMHGNANSDTVAASIAQILRLEKARFSQAMAEELAK